MLNSFGNKAQFFILTTVVIVGAFYTLSKYINPYSFIDTSKSVDQEDYFLFDNIQAKAVETVILSDVDDLDENLADYKNFVENLASEKGYIVNFDYNFVEDSVDINMFLTSEKHTLKSDFTVIKSGVTSTTSTTSSTTTTTSP